MPDTRGSADKSSLQALHARQYEFAAHLRDPEQNPPPADVEARRMAIYSDLFFNNVVSFLGGQFPIARKILGDESWRALIRDYYRDHESHSPLFPDMPREFLHYLAEERGAEAGDPAWLYELCHYEWVESGLMLAPDVPIENDIDPHGDLLDNAPVLTQPAWLLAYRYAVNEISVEQQPDAPAEQPLHYLVLRNASDEIKFNRLNIVSARLYELLQNDVELSGRAALEQIAAELQHDNPATVIQSGLNILEEWRTRGIVAGTRDTPSTT
ncbi:MAG: putative DNA-binding domain-containing protein [Gammaproteobacteria bacterium]|nr:putative DNA-binding domain-containing protein [Gammaproteobacteria bacterium]